MRRVILSVLLAGLLVALSSLAITMVNAAPAAQTTATPRVTATARTTRTPLATRTSSTSDDSPTASPEATEEATEEPSEDTTVTPEATEEGEPTFTPIASEVLTETEIITGTVLPPRFANPTDVDPGRTLTVVGMGTITTTPDVAVITLGVETTNTDATLAAEDNNEIIAEVLEIIDDAGIPRRNVQTSTFSIFVERPPQEPIIREGSEESEESTQEPAPLTYHVSQQVIIRIEDIEENLEVVSELIGASLEAGANTVFGPTFELSDDATLQQRARRAAVEDAYERAQEWATLTGVELIGVATVSEVVGGGGGPVPLNYGAVREEAQAADAGPSLQLGTISYSEQVQIVFFVR